MDLKFGTRNVWNLYKAGSLKPVSSKLARYNLDLVAVQDVRFWVVVSKQTIIHFYMEMGTLIIT
jgi:hypothetical protein